jgi:hypothetical protein
MEDLNTKHCPKCGEAVMPFAVYCQACGERLPSGPSASEASEVVKQPGNAAAPAQEFRKLRLMNWVIVALVSSGAALMLLKANSFLGLLVVAVLMAFIVGSFLLTAIVLSSETIFFGGIPVAAQRRKLKKVAVACNATLGVFGLLGLIACVITVQIGPMVVAMLVYVIPPVLNIRALRAVVLQSQG